jgi:hypothetical protein
MIAGRRWLVTAGLAGAALIFGAAAAGGQAAGGLFGAQSGFSVENVVSELDGFLPEGTYAPPGRLGRAAVVAQGGQGGQAGSAAAQQQGGQAGGQGAARLAAIMREIPTFKRDPKLFLTAKQVDAVVPALQELRANPFPTPGKAKQVQAAIDAALTKQQRDAWAGYVKERDRAIEKIRQEFTAQRSAGGTGGQGGGGMVYGGQAAAGEPGGAAGQGGQQRPQRDPAELRKEILGSFIDALTRYRKGLT